jgi:hypothetical protein
MTKTSREALLEMCVPVDEAIEQAVRNAKEIYDKQEEELKESIKRFESRGRWYRWLFQEESNLTKYHREVLENFPEVRKTTQEKWRRFKDGKPVGDGKFYRLNENFIHDPSEDLRKEMGEWSRVVPIDKRDELKGLDKEVFDLFLHGFMVKDIRVKTEPAVYVEVDEQSYSYPPGEAGWRAEQNTLQLVLEKSDEILCHVHDYYRGLTGELEDEKQWINRPEEWKKFLGKQVRLFPRRLYGCEEISLNVDQNNNRINPLSRIELLE